jgi:hypothetical protein
MNYFFARKKEKERKENKLMNMTSKIIHTNVLV